MCVHVCVHVSMKGSECAHTGILAACVGLYCMEPSGSIPRESIQKFSVQANLVSFSGGLSVFFQKLQTGTFTRTHIYV